MCILKNINFYWQSDFINGLIEHKTYREHPKKTIIKEEGENNSRNDLNAKLLQKV